MTLLKQPQKWPVKSIDRYCPICHAFLRYDKDDLQYESLFHVNDYAYIICPNCTHRIGVRQWVEVHYEPMDNVNYGPPEDV